MYTVAMIQMNTESLGFALRTLLLISAEGIVWWWGIYMLLTGYFGYSLKKNPHAGLIIGGSILLNALLAVLTGFLSRIGLGQFSSGNGVLILGLFLYLMRSLQEEKRVRRIFLVLFTMNIFMFIDLFAVCIFELISVQNVEGQTVRVALQFLLIFARQLVTLLIILFFSKKSSKYRKGPMEFSQVVYTFLLCVFLESLLNLFRMSDDSMISPIFTLRVAIQSDELRDRVAAVMVLLFVASILFIFLWMLIKQSESTYFHKKSTISEYYLEAQKNHYEDLVKSNREIRKIRHDMKNHIYCLKELSGKGRYDELEEYLKELGDSFAAASPSVQTGNEVLDAILTEKLKAAAEKKIAIRVDGTVADLQLKAIDTCTIFANLLDNAIEAVEQLEENDRKVELTFKKNQNYCLICEANPSLRRPQIVGNTIVSSKKDRSAHGFGIENIRDAVAKYDGVCSLSVSDEADEKGYFRFCMEIMLPVEKDG